MNNKQKQPTSLRRNILFDQETLQMIDYLVSIRSTVERPYNRSSMIRKFARAEYRKEMNKQAKELAQVQA